MSTVLQRLIAGDVDVDAARAWIDRQDDQPVRGVANVIVDGSGRVGPLSYLVPDGLEVRVGDAVEVPFGTRIAHGMVLGAGDAELATRPIHTRHGVRATAPELAVAQLVAHRHFAEGWRVASRLAPSSGKGADPVADPVAVLADDARVAVPDLGPRDDDHVDVVRRFAARPLGQDPARFAASVAAELAADGQVLVLCPTSELVRQVTGCFETGARRIDTKAARGAWTGFVAGDVAIGVGTRAAALYHAADLAAIVVVEQHHPGHVEKRMPHTHTRDVALLRSMLVGTPVVMTGAVPSPAALPGGVKLVEVPDHAGWPTTVLSSREGREGRSRMFTPEILTALRHARRLGVEPVVLVERRKAIHRCHRCNARRDHDGCDSAFRCTFVFDPCGDCGQSKTRPVGWDAPRIRSVLGDQVRCVNLSELQDVRDAGVVIVFDIDPVWRRPVLDPDGDAARVIGDAGRAAGPGGLLVVATGESRPLLEHLVVRRDVRSTTRLLWRAAEQAGLPPFGRLVEIHVGHKKRPSTAGWPGRVLGPRQVAGEWQILVRIEPEKLPQLKRHIDRLRLPGKVRVTVT